MKYYEEEFTFGKDTFRFKKMSPIEVLSIANQMEMYIGTNETEIYKKYLEEVLENTEVKVMDKWLSVKDGNNYFPAYIAEDYKTLRKIVARFFSEVIKPIFTESDTSESEPQ